MTAEASILDYLNLAWRRKWYFLVPVSLGLAISYGIFKKLPPVYEARATVIDERESSRYEDSRAKGVWDNPRTGLERLMRSDFAVSVARRVGETPEDAPLDPGLLGRVRGAIRYDVVGNLLYFKGRAGDPVFASKVANAYAQQFVDSTMSRKLSKTGQYATFYDKQLQEKKLELEAAEQKMVSFAGAHRGSLPDDVLVHTQAAQQLRDQLSQAEGDLQARRDEKESFVATLIQAPDHSVSLDTPSKGEVAADPRVRLRQMETELADLRTRLTERHPDVQQKLRDVEALRAEVAALPPPPSSEKVTGAAPSPLDPSRIGLNNYQRLLSIDREISRLQTRVASLRGEISRHGSAISSAGINSVEWTALNRARESLQAEYNSFLGNAQKADLTQDLTATTNLQADYRILELSDPPRKPAGPMLLALLSIGLGAGLAIGGGIIVVLEMLDQTFRTAEEVTKELGLPVVATIVRIEEAHRAEDHERRRKAG